MLKTSNKVNRIYKNNKIIKTKILMKAALKKLMISEAFK